MSHTEHKSMAHLSPERRNLLALWKRGKQVGIDNVQKIQPRLEKGPAPLSFEQQRLWFLDQLEPGNPFYNNTVCLHLIGPLDREALQQSINVLVQRHESLRTSVSTKDGMPIQIGRPTDSCELVFTDLSDEPVARGQEEALRIAHEEAQKPFDLEHDSLIRTRAIRIDSTEHLFVLTMHHIISDGWSIGIFMRELALSYNACIDGNDVKLSNLPVQYADYAVWQRQQLRDEELARLLSYWRKRLSDMPVSLALPTDYPRPNVLRHQGALKSFQLSARLSTDLKTFSEHRSVTLFTTLLAAFQVLLARYTGQSDIIIGTDSTTRDTVETEDIIGFFVNTLIMRADLSGNPSFSDFLAKVHKDVLEDFAHREIPFHMVVADLQPDRTLNREALVQVMFSFQNTNIEEVALKDIRMDRLMIDSGTAKVDLLCDIFETPQVLHGSVEYNTELFATETIERLLSHWQVILEGIIENPEQRVLELPLVTENERQQLLYDWNNCETTYTIDTTYQVLFEQQVARTPDRIAVTYQGEQVTYAELNRRANQLARHLQHLFQHPQPDRSNEDVPKWSSDYAPGVGPETLVGIYLERSIDMLIGILAVFKAGGAYIPLDMAYPTDRLQIVLQEAQVSAILSTSAWESLLSSLISTQIACLDTCQQILTGYDGRNLVSTNRLNNLAYVIYTSGSTGRPKGAMLTQDGMINHLYGKIDVLECDGNDRIAQTASLCFDISVWQFLSLLVLGGSVCIFSEDEVHNPLLLVRQMLIEGISVLELVPVQLRLLLDELEKVEEQNPALVQQIKLKHLISTGEALPPVFCHNWLQRYPHIPLVNTYGITEISDDVTHAYVRSIPMDLHMNIPSGSPIANMQVYILNQSLELAPVGVAGEIYIGGMGVGRGYLKDPTRTATVFLPNPYGRSAGERLYKSGDLGRYLPDGQIECLGRADHQVKIRGHRIELGEIEVVLEQHPAVHACAVLDWPDPSGDKWLAAYIVAKNSYPSLLSEEILLYLKDKLADYMIPSQVVLLDKLPLNANKKIDRKALPRPDRGRAENNEQYVAPRSTAEEVVASVWAELLHVERVGISDNFFMLGGHSLLATQIVLRLQDIFQVDLPVRRLFEAPTVEQVTNEIIRLKGGSDVTEEIAQIFKEIEQLSDEEIAELGL